MKYSLINVDKEENGLVDGVWIQDHIGTIETATKEAIETEIANSNKIKVAVVKDLGYSYPNYNLKKGLKRIDTRQ